MTDRSPKVSVMAFICRSRSAAATSRAAWAALSARSARAPAALTTASGGGAVLGGGDEGLGKFENVDLGSAEQLVQRDVHAHGSQAVADAGDLALAALLGAEELVDVAVDGLLQLAGQRGGLVGQFLAVAAAASFRSPGCWRR